jgi:hypothetical protein
MDQWLQLWKLRNEQRHGLDREKHSRTRERSIKSELQELYTYRERVCPADRSLFHASVSDHLTKHPNLATIEDWILNHKPAIMASTEQAQRLGILRNRTIDEYLTFNPIAQASRRASLTAGPPAD